MPDRLHLRKRTRTNGIYRMRHLKVKSILFIFMIWASLLSFLVYSVYKELSNFESTVLHRPLKLDEIVNP
jgi:hypothetical protein